MGLLFWFQGWIEARMRSHNEGYKFCFQNFLSSKSLQVRLGSSYQILKQFKFLYLSRLLLILLYSYSFITQWLSFFSKDVGQHEAAVCGATVRHRVCEGGDRGPRCGESSQGWIRWSGGCHGDWGSTHVPKPCNQTHNLYTSLIHTMFSSQWWSAPLQSLMEKADNHHRLTNIYNQISINLVVFQI